MGRRGNGWNALAVVELSADLRALTAHRIIGMSGNGTLRASLEASIASAH